MAESSGGGSWRTGGGDSGVNISEITNSFGLSNA